MTEKRIFEHGMFRVAAVSPKQHVACPSKNASETLSWIDETDADLIVFPELGLSGYTCGDLFGSEELLHGCIDALGSVCDHSASVPRVIVVGLPLVVSGALMNVAAVVWGGKVQGIVPKTFLPNYREFYEARHFRAASKQDPDRVCLLGDPIPFGVDQVFQFGEACIGVEICEDLWTPIPPSSHAALAGANVLVNLSASNETIGKAAWRRDLIRSQSGRCIAAYVYSSSGPTESSSDLVFGGHCLVAENGAVLDESRRVGDGELPPAFAATSVVCDVDLDQLGHDRRVIGSFDDARESAHASYRVCDLETREIKVPTRCQGLRRRVDAHPFVPDERSELDVRCAEIFDIQTASLRKRLTCLSSSTKLSIGVSGGLDSTLALLVAIRAVDQMEWSRSQIVGLTMPGFGTTEHTRRSADLLIEQTGISREQIDIRPLCLETFLSMGHRPLGLAIDEGTSIDGLQEQLLAQPDDAKDLTFENVQARMRTLLLMSRGFVLGTGDMSEQALGWSTYNADHMSMYNVNASIPKTLVRFLVRYAADHYFEGELREVLHRIADTPISPELLPPRQDGTIRQSTEATIGAYELHDFFLFHFVRYGFSREKILMLASHAQFDADYSKEEMSSVLDVFIKRFFYHQFKRNCVPDGPKVGSVSLSPRGDWRMPSDGDPTDFRGGS